MNIEELAFKNRVELAYLNEIDLLDIIEFLQEDRKQWINQFAKTHNESVDIQIENQKLKDKIKELKKQFENAVADYETTMSEKVELKKQLEEYKDKINWYENFEVNKTIDKLRLKHNVQQKEFIKWLEKKQSFLRDEISELTLGMCNTDFQDIKIEVYEKVLQKYKEIAGDDK